MDNTSKRLLDFVKDLNFIESNKVTEDTLIEKDLGLSGDDAIEFIEEFAEEFEVNIESFEYQKYFNQEGISFISSFLSLFKDSEPKKSSDMRLSKLIEAIEKGKLI